jgi:hypothetical protein
MSTRLTAEELKEQRGAARLVSAALGRPCPSERLLDHIDALIEELRAKNAALKSAEAMLCTISLSAKKVTPEMRGKALLQFIERNLPDVTCALDREMADPEQPKAEEER